MIERYIKMHEDIEQDREKIRQEMIRYIREYPISVEEKMKVLGLQVGNYYSGVRVKQDEAYAYYKPGKSKKKPFGAARIYELCKKLHEYEKGVSSGKAN